MIMQPMMKQQPLFGVLCIGQSPLVIQPHQSSSNTTTSTITTAQQQQQQQQESSSSAAVYHEITIDSIMTFPVASIVVYWLPLSCHMPSPLSSSHAIIYSSPQQSSSSSSSSNQNNHNNGDIDMDDMNENWTCHGCISLSSLNNNNNTNKNGTSHHHHHPSSIQFQVMNQSSVTIRVIPISQQHNHPLSLPSLPLSSNHPHHLLLDQLLSLDQLNEYMQERKQKYHRQKKKKAINQNTTHMTNHNSNSNSNSSNSSGKQQLNQVNDTLVQCYNELYKSSLQVKALAKSDLKTLERKCQDYVIHECIIPSQQHQNNNSSSSSSSSNESMLNWASEQLNYINDQMFYKLMRIDQVILTVQYHQSTTETTALSTTTTTTTTPLLSRVMMMKNKEQHSTFLKRDEGYEKQYQFVVRYLVACYERIQDKCLDMLMDLDANQLKQRKQMNMLIQQRIQQLHSMQSK